MPIIQGLVAMGVIFGLGYIIFVKIAQNNPKALEAVKGFIPTSLYTKPEIKVIPDDIQQVWDERRSML